MKREFASPEWVRDAYLSACHLDVAALKPGNVSRIAPGHGMTAEDFLCSAEVSAPIISGSSASLGERIRLAMEATRARVDCNTNLGILLLCAPLAQACLVAPAEGTCRMQFKDSLRQVLDAAGVADTEQVFAAIRLAAPGGLGTNSRHDVNDAARVSLCVAMAEAAERDSIARQYASCFEDIFSIALPALDAARSRTCNPWRAVTDLYLALLSHFPDSHVRRRHGDAVAERISAEAAAVYSRWLRGPPVSGDARLRRLDMRWKAERINPGTTADLTVATLFLDRLLTAAVRHAGDERRQSARHLHLGGAPLISTLMI